MTDSYHYTVFGKFGGGLPGDHCGGGGYDARYVCEEAGERAFALMEEERRRGQMEQVL